MHALFTLILQPKSLIFVVYFFHVETNQMFIICYDFVITKHDFYN
jgi:hypothetical protein